MKLFTVHLNTPDYSFVQVWGEGAKANEDGTLTIWQDTRTAAAQFSAQSWLYWRDSSQDVVSAEDAEQ